MELDIARCDIWSLRRPFSFRREMRISLGDQIFLGKEFFFNFDYNDVCKNEIEDNNEKICCRFGDTVSKKIDFTDYGLYRGHPPA